MARILLEQLNAEKPCYLDVEEAADLLGLWQDTSPVQELRDGLREMVKRSK